MKRFVSTITALLLILSLFAGCAPAQESPAPAPEQTTEIPSTDPTPEQEKEPLQRPSLKILTLKGPTGMGMAQLMQAMDAKETAVDYTFELAGAPTEIVGKLTTGEVDVAAAPINLAATLYNKTGGDIVVLAVNTLGVLYIAENGESINNIADLAGKTLYATGQGATPEYILNYLLAQNGVAGQVTIEYMAEHAELATLLAAGEVSLAMLPEPNITMSLMKNEGLRVALDLTEEWAKISDSQLVQGCLIARREVVENNPEAIAAFLREYAVSTAFANEHVEEAAQLIAQYDILANAQAAQLALPKCNIVCITGEEMRASASAMLQMLYDADPQSVGGQIPDDALYYLP